VIIGATLYLIRKPLSTEGFSVIIPSMAMAPGAPDRLTSPGPEPLTTW